MRFENDIKHDTTVLFVVMCCGRTVMTYFIVKDHFPTSGCTSCGHGSVLLFDFVLERVLTSEDNG